MSNLKELVIDAIKAINNTHLKNEALNSPSLDTPLYGIGGYLDSLSLVALVSEIEDQISEKYEADIILADEKMVSLKNSPFRSVEALVAYVEESIKKLDSQEKVGANV